MPSLHVHPDGHHYGWHQPPQPSHDFPMYVGHLEMEALPRQADLRPQCPPVYDQGQLGSCTANAGSFAAEFLTLQDKLPDYLPSRLAIYYWSRQRNGNEHADTGASLTATAYVLSHDGSPHEATWPYDITKFAILPPFDAAADGLKHKVFGFQQVRQDLASFKSVIGVHQTPIILGFTIYESFESVSVSRTGIVPMPRKGERVLGGHAVALVGYDDAKGWFIVRNSWGSSWGDKGYFYMPYAYLMNPRLCTDIWTASRIN